jgi:hypothetical protein
MSDKPCATLPCATTEGCNYKFMGMCYPINTWIYGALVVGILAGVIVQAKMNVAPRGLLG